MSTLKMAMLIGNWTTYVERDQMKENKDNFLFFVLQFYFNGNVYKFTN